MFTRLITTLVASPLRSLLLPLMGVVLAGAVWTTGCGKSDLGISGAEPSAVSTHEAKTIRELESGQQLSARRVPAVAVIDVNAVAQQVGMLDQVNVLVKEKERQAQQQFSALQNQLMLQYQQAEQRYSQEHTPNAQSLLDTLQRQHMQMLTAQWSNLQTEISTYHSEQKSEFLGMVRPMAFAVAKSKGMTMVLTTNQVFSVDEQADITDEVAQKMLQVIASSQQSPSDTGGTTSPNATAYSGVKEIPAFTQR